MALKAITTPEKAITEHHVFTDGLTNNGPEYIGNIGTVSAAATAIDLQQRLVKIAVSGTASTPMTLAAGAEGQVITLILTAIGTGSSDCVVTAPLYGANTTLTFNALYDTCTLVCLSGEWFILSNISVAVA
jgi:hypothetical protein